MHNFVKILVAAACALLLSACGNGVKLDTVDKSFSSDTLSAVVKVPVIKGLSSRDLESAVNDELSKTTDELLEKWQKAAQETGEQSLFDMNTVTHFNKKGLLSFTTDYEFFARKAHKTRFRIAKTIDADDGRELSFADLFDGDSYIDAINHMLSDTVANAPDKYADIWAKPKIMQNQGFYLDGDNLVIFYPPYELSYYERGFVEVPVPIEDTLSYMLPKYREIFSE